MKNKLLKTVLLLIGLSSLSVSANNIDVEEMVQLFEIRNDIKINYNEYKIKDDYLILKNPIIYIGGYDSQDLSFIKKEIEIKTNEIKMSYIDNIERFVVKNGVLKRSDIESDVFRGLMSKEEYLINLNYLSGSGGDFDINFELNIQDFLDFTISSNVVIKEEGVLISQDNVRNNSISYYDKFTIKLNTYFGLEKIKRIYQSGYFDVYSKIFHDDILNNFELAVKNNENLSIKMDLVEDMRAMDVIFGIMGAVSLVSNIEQIDFGDEDIDLIKELYDSNSINLEINFK